MPDAKNLDRYRFISYEVAQENWSNVPYSESKSSWQSLVELELAKERYTFNRVSNPLKIVFPLIVIGDIQTHAVVKTASGAEETYEFGWDCKVQIIETCQVLCQMSELTGEYSSLLGGIKQRIRSAQ